MIDKNQKKINNQEGAALLMALLILFLMMTSAVALSRIIIGEVKMTINTSNSLAAFYAADSGIEKALYYIKYTRKNRGLFDPYFDWQSTDPFNELFNTSSYDVGDGAQTFSYVQASTTSPGFIAYNVTTSTPAHVDIIDPSGDLSNIDWDLDSADPHAYKLEWSIEDCFPFHASDKLEITTHSFINPMVGSFGSDTEKDIVICNCSFKTPQQILDGESSDDCDVALTQKSILDTKFYRFSFRPLDSIAKSIIFNVHNASSEIIGIPSKMVVIVDGKYKNAVSRLKVEIPSLAALSDVFSYVIFSEEEFKKGL